MSGHLPEGVGRVGCGSPQELSVLGAVLDGVASASSESEEHSQSLARKGDPGRGEV